MFNYGGKYTTGDHTFVAQYMPIAKNETLNFGYITKPTKRLTLFSELKTSLEGGGETLMGFRVRF